MTIVSAQVQLQRLPHDTQRTLNFLAREFSRSSQRGRFVSELAVRHDRTTQQYINYNFQCSNVKALWENLSKQVFENKHYGALIKNATIVICEGLYGWDDYLLLHTFVEGEHLDSL